MAVNHWLQRSDVRAFHRTQPRANDRTSYVEPPPPRAGPNDRTDFQVGHARFYPGNLPDFMYELDPPQEWLDYQAGEPPRQKLDANGEPMWELHARPGKTKRALLDFPHMKAIEKVCTYESWWWWEMNMRLDPHFRYEDGIMRMPMTGLRAQFATEAKFRNDINMRMTRGRKKWSMACWREPRNGATGPRNKLLRTLSAYQIRNNTTRGSTPGLINASLGEVHGNRIPIPTDRKRRVMYRKSKRRTDDAARRARSPSDASSQSADDRKSSDGEGEVEDEYYAPEPRQVRSSKDFVNYAEAERFDDEDSAGSHFEAVSESPSSNYGEKDSEEDKTSTVTDPASTKNGRTKRPHDPEPLVAQNKKRKTNEDNGSGDSLAYSSSDGQYPVGAVRAARQINPPSWRREDNRRHRAAPHATSAALHTQPLPFPNRTAIFSPARSYRFDAPTSTLMANDILQTASHAATTSVYQAAQQDIPASSSSSSSRRLHGSLPLTSSNESSKYVSGHTDTRSRPSNSQQYPPRACPSQNMDNNVDTATAASGNPQIAIPMGQAASGAENIPNDLTQREVGFDEMHRVEQTIPVRALLFPDPASWCPEWEAFIINHNAEPLLKAHTLDYEL